MSRMFFVLLVVFSTLTVATAFADPKSAVRYKFFEEISSKPTGVWEKDHIDNIDDLFLLLETTPMYRFKVGENGLAYYGVPKANHRLGIYFTSPNPFPIGQGWDPAKWVVNVRFSAWGEGEQLLWYQHIFFYFDASGALKGVDAMYDKKAILPELNGEALRSNEKMQTLFQRLRRIVKKGEGPETLF